MLHGDWRVVAPFHLPTFQLKGDLGKKESQVEHPYRRSIQNGDSVEAPHSVQKGGGSCPESAPRALEAAGTRSHCKVQDTSVPHDSGTPSGSLLAPQIIFKTKPPAVPEALPDGYYSEMKKDEVLASFALALSIRPRCNLTAKTQVFLKLLILPSFSRLLIELLSRSLKNPFQIVL